ncbi:MAG: hypothetical protein C0598_09400 [Marinilabiliales bacterium]|nr:MAG: hypothetical protein C0598_09400 [Marinilabiliales bacterium]
MEQNGYAEQKLIDNTRLMYILMLVGLAFGVTAIVAVVIAYINKDDPMPDWLKTHYQFIISTFWKGLLMLVVGAITSIIIIGIFILIFWTVWIIIRCVKGMKRLDLAEAQPVPNGWMFD